MSYVDVWNDAVSRTTYAYPTTVTDPSGNYSTIKYRYDIGANVWARSPTPSGLGNTYGKTTSREYSDTTGRVTKEKVDNTGAYTSYSYPNTGTSLTSYTTIVDVNNDTYINTTDEVATLTDFDGAGRVRRTRTENPNSTGGYSGKLVEYNVLGQLKRETVPTEINSSWNPAGDDYRGMSGSDYIWLWNSKEYDWKGRVTRTVPSDSTGSDGKDTLITYGGCGCAGGQITTIQGPLVPRDDQPTENARRVEKVYADILGRAFKTENLGWTGSVYLTTQHTFNGRDQIVQTAQTEASTSTVQLTTTTYDGHGRVSTRHQPSEESGEQTSWTYNQDDSPATMTDPRGATTTYTYGNPSLAEKRPLLLGISYSPPTTQPTYTTIADTPDVSFTYDNLGNRTSMTDGSGSASYAYDSLSRMTSETKTFTGVSGNFTLGYSYQISGKLKSITDPFGAIVNYNGDKTARTTSITGSDFASQTNYATDIEYRAFGGVKEMTCGSSDNSTVSYGYDNALRATTYQATSSVISGGFVRKASYEHFADGRLKKVNNLLDSGFDRNYKFDAQGRLKSSISGQKLNQQSQMEEPFTQSITYNAFGDMTGRTNETWGAQSTFTASYTNGRKTIGNEIYDKSGNLVDKTSGTNRYERWKFDEAGRNIETVYRWHTTFGSPQIDTTQTIAKTSDGDGQDVKRLDTNSGFVTYPAYESWTNTETEYYVRSTVLGGKVVTKLDENAAKKVTLVYPGSRVFAEQRVFSGTSAVFWRHEDIATGSYSKVGVNGQPGGYFEDSPDTVEYDPLGGSIATTDPTDDFVPSGLSQFKFAGDNNRAEYGCKVDGVMQDGPGACTRLLRSGAGKLDPNHDQPLAVLHSLGIHAYWNPVSGRKPPTNPDRDTTYAEGGKWEFSVFGGTTTFNLVSPPSPDPLGVNNGGPCDDMAKRYQDIRDQFLRAEQSGKALEC